MRECVSCSVGFAKKQRGGETAQSKTLCNIKKNPKKRDCWYSQSNSTRRSRQRSALFFSNQSKEKYYIQAVTNNKAK